MFKPNIKLKKITDITVPLLEKYGINALILDVDNTLSTHHGQVLTEGLQEWLDLMRKNGIKMTVLSNSNSKRLAPFAKKIPSNLGARAASSSGVATPPFWLSSSVSVHSWAYPRNLTLQLVWVLPLSS